MEVGSETANNSVREKEKDKGSLSTSVSGTLPRSKHHKMKGSSEGAHSSSTEKIALRAGSRKSGSSKQKGSVISNIFRRLFSCVSPQHQAHIVDDGASATSVPSSAAHEKQQLNEKDKEASSNKEQTDVAPEKHEVEPSAATLTTPPLAIIDVTPPSPTDPAVVVPPSPTKNMIPESDVASGLFSGAVQPPGSKGEESLARGDGFAVWYYCRLGRAQDALCNTSGAKANVFIVIGEKLVYRQTKLQEVCLELGFR